MGGRGAAGLAQWVAKAASNNTCLAMEAWALRCPSPVKGEAGEQRVFRQFISDIIREEFGLAFRKELKSADGRHMRAWKGLPVEVAGRG